MLRFYSDIRFDLPSGVFSLEFAMRGQRDLFGMC